MTEVNRIRPSYYGNTGETSQVFYIFLSMLKHIIIGPQNNSLR